LAQERETTKMIPMEDDLYEESDDMLELGSDGDSSGEELSVEKQAKELDAAKADDKKLAEEEMQRQIDGGNDSEEDDEDEEEDDEDGQKDEEGSAACAEGKKGASGSGTTTTGAKDGVPQDVTALKQRIADDVQLLTNWKDKKARAHLNRGKRSREDIFQKLIECVATYYGYSMDLATYFMRMFKPAEAIEFFEANETPRPMTIRVNTLKITRSNLAQALIARGCNVDSVEKTKVGLKVYDSTVPVGATPEYLSGRYMIQSASSFIPVMALCPQPDETICDMAAAPGGKTTHIGQLMKNQGVLFANDLRADRCVALQANIQRMGLTNCIVTNYDGLKLKHVVPKCDRVLLDAPCSGSGIIARDPSIKVKRGTDDFKEHAKLQKELLMTAVDMVDAKSKTGGYIVYSTCSVAVEENECVIDHILRVRNVELVSFDKSVEFGREGFTRYRGLRFHPSLKNSKRFFPHAHNMDGFFVAKLKKISNDIPERPRKDRNRETVEWGEDKWTPTLMEAPLTFPEVVESAPVAKESQKAKKRRITELLKETKKRKTKKEQAEEAETMTMVDGGPMKERDFIPSKKRESSSSKKREKSVSPAEKENTMPSSGSSIKKKVKKVKKPKADGGLMKKRESSPSKKREKSASPAEKETTMPSASPMKKKAKKLKESKKRKTKKEQAEQAEIVVR